MSIANVRKELQKHDKDGLIELLEFMYKKDKSVKEYLEFYINPNEEQLLEKFRDKINVAFFGRRSGKIKYSVAKKAIAEFKKYDPSKELIADLMLYYVETGIEFDRIYDGISQPFYNNGPIMFQQALILMKNQENLELYADRAKNITDKSRTLGSEFHNYILDIYRGMYGKE